MSIFDFGFKIHHVSRAALFVAVQVYQILKFTDRFCFSATLYVGEHEGKLYALPSMIEEGTQLIGV